MSPSYYASHLADCGTAVYNYGFESQRVKAKTMYDNTFSAFTNKISYIIMQCCHPTIKQGN